ncbi:hypothetical protein AB0R12_24270, partial [Streptomyces niveus]
MSTDRVPTDPVPDHRAPTDPAPTDPAPTDRAHTTSSTGSAESDDLDALAIGWLLTSTDTSLRDLATKALQ